MLGVVPFFKHIEAVREYYHNRKNNHSHCHCHCHCHCSYHYLT